MRTWALVVLVAVVVPVSIQAQSRKRSTAPVARPLPASAFKLAKVEVVGSKRFQSDVVTLASGLQLGQTVSNDDFQAAARRLGDTGVFSDVEYSYKYDAEGTNLVFQVTDNKELVPARFENCVWFPDDDLMKELRARAPLFDGQLPLGGNLLDRVSEALQALLVEHQVSGTADYLRSGPADGPITAITFTVSGPNIRIHKVEFPGADGPELPLLLKAGKKLEGQEYLRSIMTVQAEKNFLPVYLTTGHLKAAFSESQAKVVNAREQDVSVDVSLTVTPGPQYKVKSIAWSGNKAFPVEKLAPMVHLTAGQVANAVQLGHELDQVRDLYGQKGYMAATVSPVPQLDDTQALVDYRLEVHEGDVYRMGELDIQGLDSKTTAKLIEIWGIAEGASYDRSYPARFLRDSDKALPQAYNVTVNESLNPKDKSVDITLRYDPKPQP